MDLKDIQDDIKAWADSALPHRTFRSQIVHLEKEVAELDAEEGDIVKMREELADCIILCLNIAGIYNFNMEEAVLEKMQINRNRTWEVVDKITGYTHHL